jgi:hypothetical protein
MKGEPSVLLGALGHGCQAVHALGPSSGSLRDLDLLSLKACTAPAICITPEM